MLSRISSIKQRFDNNNYAFWFLCLLSKVICNNVDPKGILTEHISNPHFYITLRELIQLFGVRTKSDALLILETLVNRYNAIDFYQDKSGKIWVHLNFGLHNYISQKGYRRHNADGTLSDEAKIAYSVNNNHGYFSFSKVEIFKRFFTDDSSHGVWDLFVLLFLNSTCNSLHTSDCFPEGLKGLHFCLWRTKNGNSMIAPRLSFYIRQPELAEFLDVDTRTIQRYLNKLEENKLISTITMPGRGICVIFNECSTEQQDAIRSMLESYISDYNARNSDIEVTYSITNTDLLPLNVHPSVLDSNSSTEYDLSIKQQPDAGYPYYEEHAPSKSSSNNSEILCDEEYEYYDDYPYSSETDEYGNPYYQTEAA